MFKFWVQWIFLVAIFKIAFASHECNRIIVNGTQIQFVCPASFSDQTLNLYDLTESQLDAITTLIASGGTGTSVGGFLSLPPNLCLLRNLEFIDFSNNRIAIVDPSNALNTCLRKIVTINLSGNSIATFPYGFTQNMMNLANVNFARNQLTQVTSRAFYNPAGLLTVDLSRNRLTSWELWTVLVHEVVDLSYNRIATITNTDFLDLPLSVASERRTLLIGNVADGGLQLNDGVYPMYNACDEVQWAQRGGNNVGETTIPSISFVLAFTQFGSTRINCGCDQYYISQTVSALVGGPSSSDSIPLYNATCTDGTLFRDTPCLSEASNHTSTVNFTTITPRLCYLYANETGNLTTISNNTGTSFNTSTRPYYMTEWMNPGACFLTFTSFIEMSMRCTIDTQESTIQFSQNLLDSVYMSTITRVRTVSNLTRLPVYLCDLPSRIIDLSGERFTVLSSETFSCLDRFTEINLAANQIVSVNFPTINLSNLVKLDLTSNRLTTIPQSFLTIPNSLRTLDLRNNSITQIDLLLFTLPRISVFLDGNPIDGLSIVNPMNVLVSRGTSERNITFPASVRTSTLTLNDDLMATALACTIQQMNTFIDVMRGVYATVQLDCSCASIYTKTIFENNGSNVSSVLNCSPLSNPELFSRLTLRNCSSTSTFLSRCLLLNPTTSGGDQSSNSNTSNNTGLIVGLVVGIVGPLLIVLIVLAVILYFKNKNKKGASSKTISRAPLTGEKGKSSKMPTRLSTRNPRSAKLAPLRKQPSKLPPVPVSTIGVSQSTNKQLGLTMSNGNSYSNGIRSSSIRSPTQIDTRDTNNGNPPQRGLGFRPIENANDQDSSFRQSSRRPRIRDDEMLNTGADLPQ